MDATFNLAPLVIVFPLVGLLINLLLSRRIAYPIAGVIASIAAASSFTIAVLLAFALARHPESTVVVRIAEWISVGNLSIDWALRVDTLSVTMMLVVAGVGALIHIYAVGYMRADVAHHGEPSRYARFFVFFNLFIVAMMILVTANNYLVLFVGWEGVGLCSYLLIGFWYEKGAGGVGNAKAATKAFVVNRIGDVGLLIAIFLLFWNFGSLDFDAVFAAAPAVAAGAPFVIMAITLCMLLGVAGKSAQLPLFVWLPDAMAGPTPVSALIHAATMVTAGVYLIVRSNPLFEQAAFTQDVVMWVGAATALLAATIAAGQFDIKRVLAFSTISQLGFMVAAAGMGAYVAAMFHLVTHAFFKALLFLASGSVIQGMERGIEAAHHGHHPAHGEEAFDAQDMRNMGGLQTRMRTTFAVFLIGALALAGIAPLSAFFSKDEILAAALSHAPGVFIVLIVAAFFTAFYTGRQVSMVFFGHPRTAEAGHATESPAIMTTPLILLAILSVVGGALNLPTVYTLEHWLEPVLEHNLHVSFNWAVAVGSTALALLALLIGLLVYSRRQPKVEASDPLAIRMKLVFQTLYHGWYIDPLYQRIIVNPYHRLADFLAVSFDLGIIDGLVNGVGEMVRLVAAGLRRLQNGFVRTYVLLVLAGVVAMLAYLAYL
ncbi:MAG: NADH-quinone oxidoreductase subunit L [Anaerolineaceae bacterium]